jgi:hypothetical protein
MVAKGRLPANRFDALGSRGAGVLTKPPASGLLHRVTPADRPELTREDCC